MKNKDTIIIASVGLVFLLLAGVLIWKGPQLAGTTAAVADASTLTHNVLHETGTAGAKVTLVEFGDYECPACAAYQPTFKAVIDEYKSNPDFNFIFRNFPLPQHKNAMISAEAAEAAGAQNKYWEMNSALYENQSDWGESSDPMPFFLKYAENIGLDVDQFKSDVESNKYNSVIQTDLNDDAAMRLNHTPTLFINGTEQQDLSLDGLKAKINSLLGQ